MMRPTRLRRERCGGQAMVEFVIGAVLFLIPVFLMIPVLGKYLDAKSTATVASRYAAWERTVWYAGSASSVAWPGNVKDDGEIANEIRQRLFSEGAGIADGDKAANDFGGGGQRVLYHNRDGSSMLADYGAIGQGITNDDAPGIVNDIVNLIVTVTDALGSFTLETKGLYTSTVTVNLGTQPIGMSLYDDPTKAFDPGVLGFTERNVILANGWSANGASHVKSQVQGLTPTSIFTNPVVEVIWTIAKVLLTPFAPEVWLLELGKVEPDVVPPDRLTD